MGKEFVQLTGEDGNALEFNRRGGVGDKIFFSLSRGGKVDYSFETVENDD